MTDKHFGFGLENLPYCCLAGDGRVGIRYRERILILSEIFEGFPGGLAELFANGRGAALEYRAKVQRWLEEGKDLPAIEADSAVLGLPFPVRNFVDFYSSREHATNVGKRFRDPAKPLPENWLHLPAGYNGRASNVFPPSQVVFRPSGQVKAAGGGVEFGPTQELDYEVELGYFLCPSEADGLAGYVLLNDWSARDIQRWEYVPLGPFLGKAFATTISPYLVLPEALEAFRVEGPRQEPAPLPNLAAVEPRNLDIQLEVTRIAGSGSAETLTRTNSRFLYWSVSQQLAHLRSGGVRLELGDLNGTGTISGSELGSEGSLLERGGPYLNDGDRLIFRGWAENKRFAVSFGEMEMRLAPAAAC